MLILMTASAGFLFTAIAIQRRDEAAADFPVSQVWKLAPYWSAENK